eukprot:scaffold106396_cov45-Phaeocystis_antarctica.AAC.1
MEILENVTAHAATVPRRVQFAPLSALPSQGVEVVARVVVDGVLLGGVLAQAALTLPKGRGLELAVELADLVPNAHPGRVGHLGAAVPDALVELEVEAVELVEGAEAHVRPGEGPGVVAGVLDELRGHGARRVAAPAPARPAVDVVGLAVRVPRGIPERGVHLEAGAPAVQLEVSRGRVGDRRVLVVQRHALDARHRVGVVVGVIDEPLEGVRVGTEALLQRPRQGFALGRRDAHEDGLAHVVLLAEGGAVRPGGRASREALVPARLLSVLTIDHHDRIGPPLTGAHLEVIPRRRCHGGGGGGGRGGRCCGGRVRRRIRGRIRRRVGRRVSGRVSGRVGRRICGGVGGSVRRCVRRSVRGRICRCVGRSVRRSVGRRVGRCVCRRYGGRIRGCVRGCRGRRLSDWVLLRSRGGQARGPSIARDNLPVLLAIVVVLGDGRERRGLRVEHGRQRGSGRQRDRAWRTRRRRDRRRGRRHRGRRHLGRCLRRQTDRPAISGGGRELLLLRAVVGRDDHRGERGVVRVEHRRPWGSRRHRNSPRQPRRRNSRCRGGCGGADRSRRGGGRGGAISRHLELRRDGLVRVDGGGVVAGAGRAALEGRLVIRRARPLHVALVLLRPAARVVPVTVAARIMPRVVAVEADVLSLGLRTRLHLVQAAAGGGCLLDDMVGRLALLLVVVPDALVVAVAVLDPLLVAPHTSLLVLDSRAVTIRVVEARGGLVRSGVEARAGGAALDGRLVIGRLGPFHLALAFLAPVARVVPFAVATCIEPCLEAVQADVLLLDAHARLHLVEAAPGGWHILEDRAARLTFLLVTVPFARLEPVVVLDPFLEAPQAGLLVLHTRAVRVHVIVATLGRRLLELVARLTLVFVAIPYARLVPVVVLDPLLVAREALVLVLDARAVRLISTNRQVVEATLGWLLLQEGGRRITMLLDATPLA